MALQGRKKLKEFFLVGKRPTMEDFEDLIDSTVNILDDGYSKTSKEGMKLTPKNENGVLMTLCAQTNSKPAWILSVNEREQLKIEKIQEDNYSRKDGENADPALFLNSPKTVVNGDIEVRGVRKGTPVKGELANSLKADGKWHDITNLKYGVYVLEVLATVQGKSGSGEYAVIMAWATQSFGNNRKIKSVGSHYGFWGHKLKLRWHKKEVKNGIPIYQLQIKSKLRYKNKNLPINCHITYLHKYEKSDH